MADIDTIAINIRHRDGSGPGWQQIPNPALHGGSVSVLLRKKVIRVAPEKIEALQAAQTAAAVVVAKLKAANTKLLTAQSEIESAKLELLTADVAFHEAVQAINQ